MKVLVVEDSINLRNSIQLGLTKLGFIVDVAADGKDAVAFVSSYNYDVVLLDIMLPLLDGFQVLKHIRQKKIDTGVIMLTAKDQIKDRVKGLEMGADDYLCKPFAFEELVARLKTVCRRNVALNQFELDFGPVSVNISMKDLTVDKQPVNLTPTEYSIVECLALSAGKVVSFSLLEDKICASNQSMSRNTLEVNISNIRRKINQIRKTDFVRTKRGMGYFIDCHE